MKLPETETLALELREGILHLTLNRPERKNAMNGKMLVELEQVFKLADEAAGKLRAVVLRGAGGSFCAGADLKDMAARGGELESDASKRDPKTATAAGNRRFGRVTAAANDMAVPLLAVLEGAVMGGGFGLACVTDIALAHKGAKFGMPETSLGLVPAQIAPFVVQRLGLTQARRLMLTGARIDGARAKQLGLVHEVFDSTEALDAALDEVLAQVLRCAPRANAATKRLLQAVAAQALPDLSGVLDRAAELFAEASLGDEGREGAQAFVDKRKPSWAR
ncbi:MAG: enoyl-CoA hydratase-related protein [Myxococcales bacterium]|nr:enoyl-CoA hydratase-related protein [Myxococcales bacterium]